MSCVDCCRLSAVESSMSTVTAAAAACSTAVQQHQLTTAVAQLSAAAVRQQQEIKAVLSGLAHRVELLEVEAARQDQVVSKVCTLSKQAYCCPRYHT